MKIKTIIFYSLSLLLLTSCQELGQVTGGTYEVSLSGSELDYVPATSNHLEDTVYVRLIDELIAQKAAAITSDANFLKLAKAIAWKESTWKHYYEENGKYYVFLGDEGHSFGMMQIYDTYHGQHPILEDNLEYGLAFAYEKYERAQANDCDSGTNMGSSDTAIARRAYAQYNGGNGAMCRNNDERDNGLEEAYTGQPWLDYM